MPASQRGSVIKRGNRWAARYYDEAGERRFRGGFSTRSEARTWVESRVDEVEALRRGEKPKPSEIPTVEVLVDSFLAAHQVDPATTEKLRHQLQHAKRAFGDRPLNTLTPFEIDAWRSQLPARMRHHYFRSFRQVLEQAVTWRLLERNPSDGIKNRKVILDESREIQPFAGWAEVEAIADELHPRFRSVPLVLVGTGLRPEELWGLERRHLDLRNRVLSIEQVYTQGRLKPCKKSSLQRRRVPLRERVCEALRGHLRRLDTPVLFPGHDGGFTKHDTFRLRHWDPALRSAGIEHRGPYACRHTFAAWSIRADVQLFYLSRIMGTSVEMISATYGHLVPDSEDYLRGLLDSYDESFGHGVGTVNG